MGLGDGSVWDVDGSCAGNILLHGHFSVCLFYMSKGYIFKNWVVETGWKELKEEGTRHMACVDTVFGIQLPRC